MKIITNIISFLALIIFTGDAIAERYEKPRVLSVDGRMSAYKDTLCVVPDNGISDRDIQHDFLMAGLAVPDARYPAVKMYEIWKDLDNIRSSFMVDNTCRAP